MGKSGNNPVYIGANIPINLFLIGVVNDGYYDDGIAWSGAGAFIGVVPVPLMAPTGKYYDRIYIRDGRTVGLILEYGEVTSGIGVACGSNDCDSFAGKLNQNKDLDPTETALSWCS